MHLDITEKTVNKEVKLGCILDPFNSPPIDNLVYSPLNIVPKEGDQDATDECKWHLIHDLAYPYNDQSINCCIPEENASVDYPYIDEVIGMAITIGTGLLY